MPRLAAVLLALSFGAFAQKTQLLEDAVENYCIDCHSDAGKTAGITLEHASSQNVGGQAAVLEKVLHKLRAGEMPPPGNPGPDSAERASLVKWLETELDKNSAAHPNPGAPEIHRLNKAEYSNAVRDLLGLDMDNAAGLPADDSGYGF